MTDGPQPGRWRTARAYLLPCALLVALFLPGVNSGFWRVDNPLYAAVAKHAYEGGSLWSLRAGESLYFNKPPLAFWAHGLFLDWFGAELWAARLPSLLVAMATVLLSVDAARRLTGPRAAMASGVVLALTLEFFRAMHAISLDLWLTLAVTGAVWCVARGVVSGRGLAAGAAAGLFIGMGLMIKPMIALAALPLIAVWLGVLNERRSLAGILLAALVGVIVALPWHLSMTMLHDGSFASEYFGSQIMDRVTSDAHGAEPWWKYAQQIGESYWPWLVSFVMGAMLLRGDRLGKREQSAVLLGVVFTLGWIAVLSVSTDKAGRYLIPIYPLASWVSGVWLARIFQPRAGGAIDRSLSWAVLGAPLIGLGLLLAGFSAHKPIPAHWAGLREFVTTHADEATWTPPRSRTLGAQIYLMTGQWPRTAWWDGVAAEDGAAPPTDGPAEGELIAVRKRGALQPRPTDTVEYENDVFLVVRLSNAWDGRYSIREGASLDEGADE